MRAEGSTLIPPHDNIGVPFDPFPRELVGASAGFFPDGPGATATKEAPTAPALNAPRRGTGAGTMASVCCAPAMIDPIR